MLMIKLDKMSPLPIYEQLCEQVKTLLLTGALKEGDALPSVRALSDELTVNPNTVQKAYSRLAAAGITAKSAGVGIFIAQGALGIIRSEGREKLADIETEIKRLRISGVPKQSICDLIDAIYKEEL